LVETVQGVQGRRNAPSAAFRGNINHNGKLRPMVHEVAAAGFSNPDDYEAARPSYPPDAVAWFVDHLRIAPGRTVVDLAAGTGKLTRLLAPTGAYLIAAEPVAGMRATFREVLPAIPIIATTAEQLAFRDGSLDAVTVAQAFHWFDEDRAIAALARAVRVGGRVGLVWNARDRSVPWVDEIWSIMDRVEKRAPWRDHEHWRDSALREMPGFGPLHSAEFRHEQLVTPEAMVRRVASVSHVAVLPTAERRTVLDEVRAALRTNPETRGVDQLRVPYRVDCFWFERV
jgi:SAM-dependent methyltransferase